MGVQRGLAGTSAPRRPKGAPLLSIRFLILNVVTDPCWADEALAQPTALPVPQWQLKSAKVRKAQFFVGRQLELL